MFEITTISHQVVSTAVSHGNPYVLKDSWLVTYPPIRPTCSYRYSRFRFVRNSMQLRIQACLTTSGQNFKHFLEQLPFNRMFSAPLMCCCCFSLLLSTIACNYSIFDSKSVCSPYSSSKFAGLKIKHPMYYSQEIFSVSQDSVRANYRISDKHSLIRSVTTLQRWNFEIVDVGSMDICIYENIQSQLFTRIQICRNCIRCFHLNFFLYTDFSSKAISRQPFLRVWS